MKSTKWLARDALLDPRRRCIPLAARAIFDDLVNLSESLGNPSIRFADRTPETSELASMFACEPSEILDAVAILTQIGLIAKCEDGAISVIPLKRLFDRFEINRANGLRGGRPRSSGTKPAGRGTP